jgi:hypothetical protein
MRCSSPVEDLFHLMVVVLIQTTQLLRFLATLHLSVGNHLNHVLGILTAAPIRA